MKLVRPVPPNCKISSPFGKRIDPVTKIPGAMHNGVDFSCSVGTEVRACVDGSIKRIGWENTEDKQQGFGYRIWQTFIGYDGKKYGLVYAHLSKIEVLEHAQVKKGEVIALTGNTGKTTGPHLHLGLREWNTGNWVPLEIEENL